MQPSRDRNGLSPLMNYRSVDRMQLVRMVMVITAETSLMLNRVRMYWVGIHTRVGGGRLEISPVVSKWDRGLDVAKKVRKNRNHSELDN